MTLTRFFALHVFVSPRALRRGVRPRLPVPQGRGGRTATGGRPECRARGPRPSSPARSEGLRVRHGLIACWSRWRRAGRRRLARWRTPPTPPTFPGPNGTTCPCSSSSSMSRVLGRPRASSSSRRGRPRPCSRCPFSIVRPSAVRSAGRSRSAAAFVFAGLALLGLRAQSRIGATPPCAPSSPPRKRRSAPSRRCRLCPRGESRPRSRRRRGGLATFGAQPRSRQGRPAVRERRGARAAMVRRDTAAAVCSPLAKLGPALSRLEQLVALLRAPGAGTNGKAGGHAGGAAQRARTWNALVAFLHVGATRRGPGRSLKTGQDNESKLTTPRSNRS